MRGRAVSWRRWRPPPAGGRRLAATPPRVAFEVVSENNADNDYGAGPRKHAAAGVGELWVFDPLRLGPDDDGGPWALQVWDRDDDDVFRRVYAGDGPAWSEFFGAWLVASSDGMLLRMSDDAEGTKHWPTEAEETECERAEKERALARVAELEALLAGMRGGQ